MKSDVFKRLKSVRLKRFFFFIDSLINIFRILVSNNLKQ